MPLIHKGVVTSVGKMSKTITVTVPFKKHLEQYKTDITRHKKYLVHDEGHQSHLNDIVTIIHQHPKFSPRKAFRLHEIHRQGQDPSNYVDKDPAWAKITAQTKANRAREKAKVVKLVKLGEKQKKLAKGRDFLGDVINAGEAPSGTTSASKQSASSKRSGGGSKGPTDTTAEGDVSSESRSSGPKSPAGGSTQKP
ncbi:hypothetical protein BD324DRAFT_653525 [Kockovaella imperatae]|uniref:Ribosomal protein S17-domain-containing protein n=1 Tax=Kockovaella imperatae TaxID=4999 RepID=A0A1Y1U9R8_9TREE|nr:hypothetical protein BD324DRAFT_653525 [Kockovaella imperatae]ORX34257.1 hypothetical protein BD324DRAFT_653525 [Kockovaella imperatae]